VAVTALLASLSVVNVVQGVAARALGLRLLVDLPCVAGFAAQPLMATQQGEIAGVLMIESGFTPALHAVAGGAIAAEIAFVRLVSIVAAGAFRLGLAEFFLRVVAILTRQDCVPPVQGKAGQRVIERFGNQPDDVSGAAFVLRVAAAARGARQSIVMAVKSLALSHISGDVLVTVQAQAFLRLLAEGRMTGTALFFDFGMTLNNRTRHHQ